MISLMLLNNILEMSRRLKRKTVLKLDNTLIPQTLKLWNSYVPWRTLRYRTFKISSTRVWISSLLVLVDVVRHSCLKPWVMLYILPLLLVLLNSWVVRLCSRTWARTDPLMVNALLLMRYQWWGLVSLRTSLTGLARARNMLSSFSLVTSYSCHLSMTGSSSRLLHSTSLPRTQWWSDWLKSRGRTTRTKPSSWTTYVRVLSIENGSKNFRRIKLLTLNWYCLLSVISLNSTTRLSWRCLVLRSLTMRGMWPRRTVHRKSFTTQLLWVLRPSSPKTWRVSTMDNVLMWLLVELRLSQWLTNKVSLIPLAMSTTLKTVRLLNTISPYQFAMPLPSISLKVRLLTQLSCMSTTCSNRVWLMSLLAVYVTSTTWRSVELLTLRRRVGNPIDMPWNSTAVARSCRLTRCCSSPTPRSSSRGWKRCSGSSLTTITYTSTLRPIFRTVFRSPTTIICCTDMEIVLLIRSHTLTDCGLVVNVVMWVLRRGTISRM